MADGTPRVTNEDKKKNKKDFATTIRYSTALEVKLTFCLLDFQMTADRLVHCNDVRLGQVLEERRCLFVLHTPLPRVLETSQSRNVSVQ